MPLLASPKYAFKEALIHTAPEAAGVYAIYFAADLLYVGIAKGEGQENPDTIRARLLAHFHGDAKPAVATHYTWETTSQPEMRLAELFALLGPYRPPYNDDDTTRRNA
jgi:hypothetical protein